MPSKPVLRECAELAVRGYAGLTATKLFSYEIQSQYTLFKCLQILLYCNNDCVFSTHKYLQHHLFMHTSVSKTQSQWNMAINSVGDV